MRNMDPERGKYSVDAVANALRTLRLLQQRGSLTVTSLSLSLGVGKSTAHRILQTMVDEGFVVRDPVKRDYRAGQVLISAGLSVLGHFDFRRRAREPMVALARRTGESFKLIVLEGAHTRVLHVVQGSRQPQVRGRIGEVLYANATAGGKLLLSHESQDMLKQRFEKKLPSLTQNTICDWDELAVELRTIRDRQWATSFEESTLGLNGLAVPVMKRFEVPILALAMAAPTDRLTRGGQVEYLGLMMNASHQMAQSLKETDKAPQRLREV